MEKKNKNKAIDVAVVTAKSVGWTLFASACGRGFYPSFYKNIWREQRNSRQFRDALEESGVPLDFGVKIIRKGQIPKISSLTGASWSIGCDKWELAYYLVKHGSCSYGDTKAEIVR